MKLKCINMLNDLKQIEKDLHRELTDDEAAYIFQHGWKAFFTDKLNWDDEDYIAYRRLMELLITFFTKHSEFSKLYESKDFDNSFVLLQHFLNAIVDEDNHKFQIDDEEDECPFSGLLNPNTTEEEKYTLSRYCQVERVVTSILEAGVDKHWLDLYDEVDPNHTALISYAGDIVDEHKDETDDEVISDGMDVLKDEVVKDLAEKLKKSGEKMTLPYDVIDEVSEYLFAHEKNIFIQIRNNEICVKA